MKSIEISTSQNVIVKYELASPFFRFAAFLIDGIIMSLAMLILAAALNGVFRAGFWQSYLYLPFMFYTLFFENLMKGSTPGKRLLQIRVLGIDGRELKFTDYLMRWMFRIIDIYATSGALAVFTIISSDKYQRTGDYLANTCVVVLKKHNRFRLNNLLRFDKLEEYTPSVPQVTMLSEEEMLLVKEVVDRYRQFPNDAHRLAVQTVTGQLTKRLSLAKPDNEIAFLRGLIKDYVILTR